MQGASIPVLPGITPGSGPGHLGLFGYDPLKYVIGRGALEATGVGFELQPGDVAIRCNFCTLDATGNITDRRAGRIPTEESAPLAISLRKIVDSGHRDLRRTGQGASICGRLSRRRSGRHGRRHRSAGDRSSRRSIPLPATRRARRRRRSRSSSCVRRGELLAGQPKANFLTMRGFAAKPHLPPYQEVYGLRAAAIAVYPMYKGLARLVGMDIVGQATTLDEQIDLLEQTWAEYDFFFVHFKYTDSTGEDGNFDAKVEADRRVRRDHSARHGVEARRADRDRRPQHAGVPEEPQLASGADAAGLGLLPAR